MNRTLRGSQRGQAIVLIALMIVVMFGLVGLAIDSGRAYLDRRHLQAAVDAAALAAAYNYMNTTDYAQAEQSAVNTYSADELLYGASACAGLGTVDVSCTFSGDSSNQRMTINVANQSVAAAQKSAASEGEKFATIKAIVAEKPEEAPAGGGGMPGHAGGHAGMTMSASAKPKSAQRKSKGK